MSDNKKHHNQGPLIFIGIAIGIVAILLGVLVYQNHESSQKFKVKSLHSPLQKRMQVKKVLSKKKWLKPLKNLKLRQKEITF